MRESVSAILAVLESGDLEQLVAYVDPDFMGVVPPSMSAEPDVYPGVAGIRRYFELWSETVDGVRFGVQEAEEVGDWVVASLRITGTGRGSGLPLDAEVFTAIEMRGEKMLRMEGHPTLEEARASAAAAR